MKAKIRDIYTYAKSNNLKLFGDVSAFSFMGEYSSNSVALDYLFNKKFSSFLFLTDFPKSATLETVYADFTTAVNAHLVLNNKRYSELYRVQLLADSAYDIVNNYDLHENVSRETSGSNSLSRGARSDSDAYGAKSTSDNYGARTDSTTVENGAQSSTTEKEVAGFNSPDYVDADKESVSIAANTSGGSTIKGAQADTHTEQARTDTHTIGAQTESGTNSGNETITSRKYGNIGVQTPADIIGGHIRLWDAFNFYGIIFKELSQEFLLLSDDFISSDAGSFSESEINEIMTKLNSIQAQITTSTQQIREDISEVSLDDSNIITAVNNARDNIKANDDANAGAITTAVNNARDNIKANDDANTASIRGDITEVLTDGY
jgi:hypothetical protein